MCNPKYNNTLVCKRYYDRNKGNPEFMARKAVNTMRYYYKKKCHILYKRKYPMLWSAFLAWKDLFIKEIVKATVRATALKVFKKRIEECKVKRNKRLLKRVIDAWKEFEITPHKTIGESIICFF
jgi:hypothetical protein